MSIQDKFKIQVYLSIVIAIAGAMHVFFGIYFAYLGIYQVVFLNAIDVVVYIAAYLINRTGRTRLASFIIVFKVIIYSLMATFLFGTDVNAQWFIMVAALPAALYLDFTKLQRILIVAAMPFLINLQLSFPWMSPPPFDMGDNIVLRYLFANVIVFSFIFTVTVYAIITRKVADMQAKEIDDLEHKSNIDPLTELNNRRHAEQFFKDLVANSQNIPSVFCLIDIDDFKSVNDTYGHNVGDTALSTVANILRGNTRQTDLVCRWGGEEFLVVLPKCNLEAGSKILEKIRKAVENEAISSEAGKIKITITAGASILTDNNIEMALINCDKNLYEGKRSGKNKIVI